MTEDSPAALRVVGDDPQPERLLRTALGSFPTGVVVVTTHGPVGVTCQTFCSLSLDPPLVGFSIASRSRTWARMRAEGTVCFNFLPRGRADLAVRFATLGVDRFADVRWDETAGLKLPRLAASDTWVEGVLEAAHGVGDHDFAVIRVSAVAAASEWHPLLYLRGEFAYSGLTETAGRVTAV